MHIPVLRDECVDMLHPQNGKTYLDATFGWGGHTQEILRRAPEATLVGLDRDADTLKLVQQRFPKNLNKNLFLFHGNFKEIDSLRKQSPVKSFDGILIDLGFSSLQIAVV